MEYKVIRSKRKSISIQVDENGAVIVKAPLLAPTFQIERFVKQSSGWIEKTRKKREYQKQAISGVKKMSPEQFARLKKLARQKAMERISYYAPKLGVSGRVGKISIRCQKTRWGSCTREGNISLNCLLALAPSEVFDAIIVHELCHLIEMNHSSRFYSHIYRVFPDYKKCKAWLNKNGSILHAMIP